MTAGPFTVGAVEPPVEAGAVASQHLRQHVVEHAVVLRRAIRRVIAIPGGQVDAEAKALSPAGVRQLTQDVAAAVPPRAGLDAVRRILRRPEAESVVVLRRDDHACEARLLERADPLACIELRGVEDLRILAPAAPL